MILPMPLKRDEHPGPRPVGCLLNDPQRDAREDYAQT